MRFEHEMSTVAIFGVKRKTPGQQGASLRYKGDEATHTQQYLRYLYPYVKVLKKKGMATFEARLDIVAYHLDWSRTKGSSRQDVSHGHLLVNGHRVTAPGYKLKIGDVLECGKDLASRFGFSKPYYSSCEVNHRIRAAIFINPRLPCETSVCNVRRYS